MDEWVEVAKEQMQNLRLSMWGSTWKGEHIGSMSDKRFMEFIGELVDHYQGEIRAALEGAEDA